ncbi:MAG: hypothetical protein AB8G05_21280 [Oligoflexales bacterium]
MNYFTKIFLLTLYLELLASSSFADPYTHEAQRYYSQKYLDRIKKHRITPVIVVTGWSENSLHSSSLKQAHKQTRAFAPAYLLAVRLYQIYGKVKLFYLSTTSISEEYRRYLYRVGSGDFGINGFKGFENYALRMIVFNKPRHRKTIPSGNLGSLQGAMDFPLAQDFFFSKRNQTLLKTLKAHMAAYHKSSRFEVVGLDAHSNSPVLNFIAEYLNIPLLGNKQLSPDVGSKSQSRRIYEATRILHPKGSYFPGNSPDYLAEEIYDLLKAGAKKVILKIDRSSAGEGLEILDFSNDLAEGFVNFYDPLITIRLILQKIADLSSKFLDKLYSNGAIVEEYIDGISTQSPAAMLIIEDETKVELLSLYFQQLGGDQGLSYQGSIGPLNNTNPKLVRGALAIGNTLAKTGIRGPIGIDFLSGTIIDQQKPKTLNFAIENNIRHPSTMYPYMSIHHLLGAQSLKTKYYRISETLRIPIMINSKIRLKHQTEFYKWLSHQDFTFSQQTEKGVLIHGEYSAIGKLAAIAVGNSPEEAAELLEQADQEIRQRIRFWGCKYARENLIKAEF